MDPHSLSLFITLVLLFGSAIVGGLLAFVLKMPLVLGYIVAGIITSSIFSQFVDKHFIELLAQSGVTLLLFTLGLEFSFYRLRKSIKLVFWPAIAQIVVSISCFLVLSMIFGFTFLVSAFFACAMALSSTAIIVKILSEKGELETVPGELATAWLVVQDLAVIPMMVLLPVLARLNSGLIQATVSSTVTIAGLSIVKASVFLILILFLGRKGIPWLLSHAARIGSRELFLLFTIAVVFISGISAYAFGLSAALGAFIAGLLLAETSQNHAIFSEIRPLRDIFAVIFFVSLGFSLPFAALVSQFGLVVIFTVIVFIVKWFIVYGLSRFVGYHRKTAFFVALALTEMSEFGFIIANEGISIGALSQPQYTFLIGLTMATLLVSTPLIGKSHAMYYNWYKFLGRFWPILFSQKTSPELNPGLPMKDHIVICGYGRVGKYIGRALEMAKIPFVVVDYNHSVIEGIREKGGTAVFGDPADKDVLDYAQVDLAKAIVIAIPDSHTQKMIISNALTLNRRINILCRSHHEEDQKVLKSLGVHVVIQPEFEASVSIVEKLLGEFGLSGADISGKVSRLKIEHGLG